MLEFKDFAPAMVEKGGFLRPPTYEALRVALDEANRWIATSRVEVINVETVVLPSMHDTGESGTEDVSLPTSGRLMSSWHQFIRVWYEA